jgi:DNA-binding MarR family transcriptional regulator
LAVMRLSRRLRQQVAGGATPSQVSALATVERLGTPTLGELAASEKVRPPSMTRIVVGLEEAGLVTRQIDADDRRVARVMLTAEGRRVLQRSRSLRTAFLARRLQRLSAPERQALGELVGLLELLVEEA